MAEQKYENLKEVLDKDSCAYEYFKTLPEYIRQMITDRSKNMHTEEDIRNYAHNLLRGDY